MNDIRHCDVSLEPCGVCDVCRARRRSGRRKKNRQKLRKANRIRKKAHKKREQVWLLYGKNCYLCGGRANTIDHVVPLSKGGESNIENLRPACYTCNHKKGNKSLEEI